MQTSLSLRYSVSRFDSCLWVGLPGVTHVLRGDEKPRTLERKLDLCFTDAFAWAYFIQIIFNLRISKKTEKNNECYYEYFAKSET